MAKEKIKAIETIAGFMGELCFRYSAADMSDLWAAMDAMRQRYGDIFVAASITKSKSEAELALFRYGHKRVTA